MYKKRVGVFITLLLIIIIIIFSSLVLAFSTQQYLVPTSGKLTFDLSEIEELRFNMIMDSLDSLKASGEIQSYTQVDRVLTLDLGNSRIKSKIILDETGISVFDPSQTYIVEFEEPPILERLNKEDIQADEIADYRGDLERDHDSRLQQIHDKLRQGELAALNPWGRFVDWLKRVFAFTGLTGKAVYNEEIEPEQEFYNAFNGIVLNISTKQANDIKKLRGVKEVYLNKKVEATLMDSVPLINSDKVWKLGYTGEGMTIAIIDTGIDYTHPDLGGCLGPECKVIGGHDFINDDEDPMDDNGHGTHCAGIAAGEGGREGGIISQGDRIKLEKTTNMFNLGDRIDDFYTTLDDEELSNVLSEGVYTNDENNNFQYEQEIILGNNIVLEHFADSDYLDDKPVIGFNLRDGDHVLNYTLNFIDPARAGGSWTTGNDLETTIINMLGKDFYILSARNTTAINHQLTLVDYSYPATVTQGESEIINIDGKEYNIYIEWIDSDEVILNINGVSTNKLSEGGTYNLESKLYITVLNNLYTEQTGGVSRVEVSLGTGKLVLENMQEVEVNGEKISHISYAIPGSLETLSHELLSFIDVAGTNLEAIKLQWKVDEDVWLSEGSRLVFPGFESFEFSMEGFNTPAMEITTIKASESGESLLLLSTITQGDIGLDILSLNEDRTAFDGLGEDDDEKLFTTTSDIIYLNRSENTQFVATWINGDDHESYAFEIRSIDNDGKTVLKNLAGGSDLTFSGINDDVDQGQIQFTLNAVDESNRIATIALTTSTGVGNVYADRIVTQEGLTIMLPLEEQIIQNPARFVLNLMEEDKDGEIAAGSVFYAEIEALEDHGAGIVSIGGANGPTFYRKSPESDIYEGYVISDLATQIFYKTPPWELADAKIVYHGEQAYADVYVQEGTSTTFSGGLNGIAPDAKLYSYKVLDEGGSGSWSEVISGIERAIDPNDDGDFSDHVDVISLSLGGGGDPDDPVATAVDNAADLGVAVVVAAGNDGPFGISSPGCARKAITIGATDKNDEIADFSSIGPIIWDNGTLMKPDVVAPGVDICSAQWDDAWLENQCLDDEHTAISGTSMATPHVAGISALLKQKYPDLTSEEVKSLLKINAIDLGYPINVQGTGRVDALTSINSKIAVIGDLDFGRLAVGENQAKKKVKIKNLLDQPLTISLSAGMAIDEDGNELDLISLNKNEVVLGAYGEEEIEVAVSLSGIDGDFKGKVILNDGERDYSLIYFFSKFSELTLSMEGDHYPNFFVHDNEMDNFYWEGQGGRHGGIGNSHTFLVKSGEYTVYVVNDFADPTSPLDYPETDEYILTDVIDVPIDSVVKKTFRLEDGKKFTIKARSLDNTPLKLYEWGKGFTVYKNKFDGCRKYSYVDEDTCINNPEVLYCEWREEYQDCLDKRFSAGFYDPVSGDREVYVSKRPDNGFDMDVMFKYQGGKNGKIEGWSKSSGVSF